VQTGAIGVATLHMRERLASRRPGVMFLGAPEPGRKGPAWQEQLVVLNRQVRFGEDEGRCRAAPGRECSVEAWRP
jgi:hypothetical protein